MKQLGDILLDGGHVTREQLEHAVSEQRRRGRVVAHLPDSGWCVDALVLLTLVVWATALTWSWGGRDPHVLSLYAFVAAAAMLAVRPWRRLPLAATALVTAVGLAAVGVCVLSPTGWAGASDAATYVVSSQVFATVAAWARDRSRQTAVLAVVLFAAAAQFAQAWPAWWAGQDPTRALVGSFYWHNPAGAYMAAGAACGLAAVAFGQGAIMRLAAFSACAAGAGVYFTTSRGSLLVLLLALAATACAIAVSDLRRRRSLRLSLTVMTAIATTWILSGPPFFPNRPGVGAGVEARGESAVGNGAQRLEDWRRAWEIFLDWPLTGAGFKSFNQAASLATDNRDGVNVASAHNGYLQALADGGLLLAVPFWAAVLCVVAVSLRRLPAVLERCAWPQLAVTMGLGALLLHAGIDFDFGYPALMIMAGVLAGVACSTGAGAATGSPRLGAVLMTLSLCLTPVVAVAGWDGGTIRNVAFEADR